MGRLMLTVLVSVLGVVAQVQAAGDRAPLIVSEGRLVLAGEVMASPQALTAALQQQGIQQVSLNIMPCTSNEHILHATTALAQAGVMDFYIDPAQTLACGSDAQFLDHGRDVAAH